ncbi:uncharacterized protein LOC118015893 [Mirounga leonina]|uniref:uncharacterized protein LOC118015893 n=1 Tax=Mirounga leonina TaxID=9715 RepID=UPI00156C3519|nr:uncharacterized protein LOC118015893 [Mirounga leonina]
MVWLQHLTDAPHPKTEANSPQRPLIGQSRPLEPAHRLRIKAATPGPTRSTRPPGSRCQPLLPQGRGTDARGDHEPVVIFSLTLPVNSEQTSKWLFSGPRCKYVGVALLLLQFEPGQSSPMRESSDYKDFIYLFTRDRGRGRSRLPAEQRA